MNNFLVTPKTSSVPFNKFFSIFFLLRKRLFEFYCACFLFLTEPVVFFAQLLMRRDWGLAGPYQFHRLYEIKKVLKSKQITSAIEFGSGASSLLFNKYVEHFVSIEESQSWADHYFQKLGFLRNIKCVNFAKLSACLKVLPRVESIDTSGELVCYYRLPEDVINAVFSLAYIDGPTSWIQNTKTKNVFIRDKEKLLPNVSVLDLKFTPPLILVDGRRATISYLIQKAEFLGGTINLRGPLAKPRRVRPYHTVITI